MGNGMNEIVPVQVQYTAGEIKDNLDAVEASIREKTDEYTKVVITADSLADGKNFLAEIRKEQKALDDQRKAIKKQWMAPYERFEARAKKIINLYDEPIKAINDQLSEYEKTRREEKRKAIRNAYDAGKGELGDWLPLERIYNTRWENATYDIKKVAEDIGNAFAQIQISIDSVKAMESEFEAEALDTLKKTGSLQDALQTIKSLKAQKERFEAAAREKAEREMREAREREERERERAAMEAQEREAHEREERERTEREAREREFQATADAKETADMMPFGTDGFDEPGDETPFEVSSGEPADINDFNMEAVEIRIRVSDHEKLMDLLSFADFEWEVI